MMGYNRPPPNEPPPAYRYVTRVYKRSLKPVVIAVSLLTAIWALAWTVSSFKELRIANSDDLPDLAPLAIAQGVMYATACAIQVFGVVAAILHRLVLIRMYSFLCGLAALLVFGVAIMRVVTHFVFKSELITECTTVAQTGTISSVFGIWGTNPTDRLNETQAMQYCNYEWSHDSWAEIAALLVVTFFGLFFTAIAFAYYRQSLEPTNPAYAGRLPPQHARTDGHPTHYNPPYDGTAYVPVYLPPPGPPPADDGKPPEYKRSMYVSPAQDKDVNEDDPFSGSGGPSVPMPTHWVEDRDDKDASLKPRV